MSVEFSSIRVSEVAPVANLIRILESFPYVLKRDCSYLKRELQDERDVQRVLWTMLRPEFPDLLDEESLGRFGLKNYQSDFGIPSLQTIVEVKVMTATTTAKAIQEALMTDAVGYFKTGTLYRHLVPFIYNKANRAVDSALTGALLSLDPVAAVVVVPGVSWP